MRVAIKPDVFNLPSFVKEQAEEEKGTTDEEKILAAGSETIFWKTLNEHIEKVISELDEVNTTAIASGSSFEELGRNTLVITLTKGVLRKIFNKVQDAREAVEEDGKRERERGRKTE